MTNHPNRSRRSNPAAIDFAIWRAHSGLGMTQAARALGIDRTYAWRLENAAPNRPGGAPATLSTAMRLAMAAVLNDLPPWSPPDDCDGTQGGA